MPARTIKTQELEIRTQQTKLIVLSVMLICVCIFTGYLLFKCNWTIL